VKTLAKKAQISLALKIGTIDPKLMAGITE
jgi:hypothetical protein